MKMKINMKNHIGKTNIDPRLDMDKNIVNKFDDAYMY